MKPPVGIAGTRHSVASLVSWKSSVLYPRTDKLGMQNFTLVYIYYSGYFINMLLQDFTNHGGLPASINTHTQKKN